MAIVLPLSSVSYAFFKYKNTMYNRLIVLIAGCIFNFVSMMAVPTPFPRQNPCTVWWNSILLVNHRLMIIDISLYKTSRIAIPLNLLGIPFGMSTSMPIPNTLGIGPPLNKSTVK
jgi:hypothetical protein